MNDKRITLTRKETLFCQLFASYRNQREAALRAGFNFRPERTAARLLERPEIQKEIRACARLVSERANEASAGYRRVAFGSVADALILLYQDSFSKEELEALDLFSVSEIRQIKGGGLEIKFFDRLKALEKLSQIEAADSERKNDSFYQALEEGARVLSEQRRGEERFE